MPTTSSNYASPKFHKISRLSQNTTESYCKDQREAEELRPQNRQNRSAEKMLGVFGEYDLWYTVYSTVNIMFYSILLYSILFYSLLFYSILYYSILYILLYDIMLYYIIL